MKTTLLVISSLGVLQASAVAGTSKKPVAPQKIRVAAVETVEAALPIAALPEAVAPALATTVAPESDIPAIPELPVDASSALVPFPELEKAPLAKPGAKKLKPAKAPVAKLGKGYVLGRHTSDCPSAQDTERVVPKSLSRAQVASVVEAHKGDIQLCVSMAPASLRVNEVALSLSISETGSVSDLAVPAGLAAVTHNCISAAVSKWSFPVAETASELDYAIALRAH
jgi:hypothetical protein